MSTLKVREWLKLLYFLPLSENVGSANKSSSSGARSAFFLAGCGEGDLERDCQLIDEDEEEWNSSLGPVWERDGRERALMGFDSACLAMAPAFWGDVKEEKIHD